MSSLFHDPINNVSVKVGRDENGRLTINIKGPDESSTVTYNDSTMVTLRPLSATNVSNVAGGHGANVTCDCHRYVVWEENACGGGISGGGGGGAATPPDEDLLFTSSLGVINSSVRFVPPEGVIDVVVASGGFSTQVKLKD